MPDVDVVERSLTPPWRSVFRLIKGQQPRNVVCKGVLQALAFQLRSDGGVPALISTAKAVARATSSGKQDRSFSEALREIERRFNQSGTAKGTAEAARRLAEKVEVGQALPGLVPLAEEHCWGLIDRHLFGRLQRFVGTQHEIPSFEALSKARADCRQELEPEVRRMARSLAADPLASRLRAPVFSPKRPTTSALLEEPL
jgi:hypothetical protein